MVKNGMVLCMFNIIECSMEERYGRVRSIPDPPTSCLAYYCILPGSALEFMHKLTFSS